MKRSRYHGWWVPALLGVTVLVYGAPPLAVAQDKESILAADRQRDAFYKKRLDEISRGTYPDEEARRRAYDETYAEWLKGKQQTAGLVGSMNKTAADIENAGANRPPGFWDKVGDTALGIIGEALKEAIKNWMNNPSEENLRRIEELEAERDRLLTERNNPDPNGGTGTDGSGVGRPVYDSDGNIVGWDRDGDGRPDMTDSNGDGTPDTYNGGTNDTAYSDPYEYLNGGGNGVDINGDGIPDIDTNGDGIPDTPATGPSATNPGGLNMIDTNGDGIPDAIDANGDGIPDNIAGNMSGGGGGITPGGNFNGGGSGGVGAPGEGAEGAPGEGDLAAADGEGGTPTGSGERGKAGSFPKTEKDKNGDGIDDEEQLVMISGRPIVLPKATPGAAATGVAGNRMPSGPVEDDWNDMEDNGDAEDDWGDDWGDGWGDESTTGSQPAPGTRPGALPGAAPGAPAVPGAPGSMGTASEATKLVDQLIRVETVIAEWRKKAKDEAEGKTDPYGFDDARGYRAGGTTKASQDPLAELRGPDGKLDLTRCEIWIVERDTWQEGKEPKRYQVTVTEDALDQFDPIQGGYIVVRGIIGDVSVDQRVIQEIKGEVKKVDVVQVVLSEEKPPEGLSGTTPTEPLPPLDEGDDGWK